MKFDRKFLMGLLTEFAGIAIWAVVLNTANNQPLGSMAEKAILGGALLLSLVLATRDSKIVGTALVALSLVQIFKAFTSKEVVVKKFTPSEANKQAQFLAYNNQSVTLEEEVVHNMIPFATNTPTQASYQPVLGKQHLATSL
jgi:hypothetical protein